MSKQSLNSLVIFTQQFASLTRAELPILKSLKSLEKETVYPSLKSSLQNVIKDVERGVDLDKALTNEPKTFDSVYISMVKAGIDSGNIALTLSELSKYITKSAQMANKISSAVTYPLFMFFVMIFIITLMLVKIIPTFKGIFEKAGKDLPESTQIAISISNFIMDNYILLSLLIVIIILLIVLSKGNITIKRFIDNLKLTFFGNLVKKSAIARFSRTLGVLIKAGIPILGSIEIAKSSTKNVVIEEAIGEVINLVNRGEGIAESLKKAKIFPDIFIQITVSGEESANLDELFIDLADYYDDQVDNELSALISIINPIMTVVMGSVVLGLMVSVFEPIFKIGDTIGR